MSPKTVIKIGGVVIFGYLCMGAGAVIATDHAYRRAAKQQTWR